MNFFNTGKNYQSSYTLYIDLYNVKLYLKALAITLLIFLVGYYSLEHFLIFSQVNAHGSELLLKKPPK